MRKAASECRCRISECSIYWQEEFLRNQQVNISYFRPLHGFPYMQAQSRDKHRSKTLLLLHLRDFPF